LRYLFRARIAQGNNAIIQHVRGRGKDSFGNGCPRLGNIDQLLSMLTLSGLRRWANFGADAYRRDLNNLVKYFNLESADSKKMLQQERRGTLFIDTQRKLKSRDALAETLDIRIVDGAGERPYDNYSGGEQFRINFAIRLALSQVLAKRAGARLQTLVIDEGFGSQDPNGRQRLVEAINAIQEQFARILVITHIDELRDAFPHRIEVEKTAVGSKILVE